MKPHLIITVQCMRGRIFIGYMNYYFDISRVKNESYGFQFTMIIDHMVNVVCHV